IELRSDASGKQTAITADALGRFRAPGLPAGSYQIKIDHAGFRTFTQAAVLEDTQTNAFEFRLETAEVEQAVQVAGKSAAGANSDPNYRALRAAQLSETYSVSNLTLQRDAGALKFKSGTISFTPPVLGKVTLGVFVGEGEFSLKPVHWTEAQQLKRTLNRDSIEESFRQAVLCFTDESYKEIRAAAQTSAAEPRAAQVLQEFRRAVRQQPEQVMENVDAEILADLYNPAQPGFFSAF